jgi:hypothetical protein
MDMKDKIQRYVIALSIILAFSFVWGAATAATGTAAGTWTRPTTYVDGTPLPASAITGYVLGCRFTPTGGTAAPCSTFTPATFPASATSGSVTVSNLPPTGGNLCLTLNTQTATATSDNGVEQCKPVPAVAPNAPGNFTITVTVALVLQSDSPITVASAVVTSP